MAERLFTQAQVTEFLRSESYFVCRECEHSGRTYAFLTTEGAYRHELLFSHAGPVIYVLQTLS